MSEEAQALVKQRDEQHKIKMIQFNKEKKQRRGKESGRQVKFRLFVFYSNNARPNSNALTPVAVMSFVSISVFC